MSSLILKLFFKLSIIDSDCLSLKTKLNSTGCSFPAPPFSYFGLKFSYFLYSPAFIPSF